MPAALLLHVTRYSIFSNNSISFPGLHASIGVTSSYSSRPFLCALVGGYIWSGEGVYLKGGVLASVEVRCMICLE